MTEELTPSLILHTLELGAALSWEGWTIEVRVPGAHDGDPPGRRECVRVRLRAPDWSDRWFDGLTHDTARQIYRAIKGFVYSEWRGADAVLHHAAARMN